ncbi:hypothetical protein ACFL5O_06290 [Myxococcota bacterium]
MARACTVQEIRCYLEGRRFWPAAAIAVVGAGVALRVALAVMSIGSNDAVAWHGFATYLSEHSLTATYRHLPLFNHPPLMAAMAVAAREVSDALGLRFALVFKLPAIAAEAAVIHALWRLQRFRGPTAAILVATIYALNPATALVSGYHGNTDCLCAGLILVAVALAHARRSAFWVGLTLAGAINVKLIPVLLVPVLAAHYRDRWNQLGWYAAGLAVGALPFLSVLPAWDAFHRNAIAYNSFLAVWGLGLFYLRTAGTLPWVHYFLADVVLPAGRNLILGTAVVIAVWQFLRPRWSLFEAVSLSLSGFLIFAPGFGIQYIVYPLPVMFLASRGAATRFALLSGTFAAIVYYTFWTRTWPAYSHFNAVFYLPPSELVGLLAWTSLIGFAARLVYRPTAGRPRL